MSIQVIPNENSLQTAIANAGSKLVVVDFFAKWCAPCEQMSPLVDHLSSTVKASSAIFMKVDIDDNPGVPSTFSVFQLPTFIFFLCGKEVDRCGGSFSELESKVVQWTSESKPPSNSTTATSKSPPSIFASMFPTTGITEKQFHGQGNRLGDKTEDKNEEGSSSAAAKGGWFSTWFQSTPKEEKPKEVVAQEKMGVDQNLPCVPIQVRLVDSTKLKVMLNMDQSVSKIRDFILEVRPEFDKMSFTLLNSFPQNGIIDETKSIAEAELAHALVIQKLIKM